MNAGNAMKYNSYLFEGNLEGNKEGLSYCMVAVMRNVFKVLCN